MKPNKASEEESEASESEEESEASEASESEEESEASVSPKVALGIVSLVGTLGKCTTNKAKMEPIKLPYNELVVGMTGSGKSHYLTKHLETVVKNNPSLCKIFIICPTIEFNRTFLEWKLGTSKIIHFIGCHQNNVDDELREIIGKCKTPTYKGSDKVFKTLVVLDDCAHGQDIKSKTSNLVELAFTGRHIGVGLIVLTQQLTSISKAYRDNITKLVTFYSTSKKDTRLLFNDYLGNVSKEECKQIQHKLKTTRFSHLVVSRIFPYEYTVL